MNKTSKNEQKAENLKDIKKSYDYGFMDKDVVVIFFVILIIIGLVVPVQKIITASVKVTETDIAIRGVGYTTIAYIPYLNLAQSVNNQTGNLTLNISVQDANGTIRYEAQYKVIPNEYTLNIPFAPKTGYNLVMVLDNYPSSKKVTRLD